MKVVFLFAILSVSTYMCYADEEKYTAAWDNINIDEVMNNERLMKQYMDCILDKGPCSPDGKELKKHIPDAVKTKCAKCTDKQKEGAKKVIRHLIEKRPNDWEQLKKKFDPTGEAFDAYKKELNL
ncbi:ejaculatory bulb-specific protein 3-like [Lycorma delicatula]|uniref:ejaculatory bulb-specific protein 3-like n=1 Tax=Lycorma delicatula TaxID=130591 RepID=UPI003F5198C3